MNHLLLENAFVFEKTEENFDPKGYHYDFVSGAWIREEGDKIIELVRSNNPDKPICGTKKADRETGEDQKGM